MMNPIRVLYVDDDKSIALVTSELLSEHGFEVDVCHDGATALHRLGDGVYDIAILDVGLPMFDGKELFANIKTAKLETQVIFVTGNASIDVATKLMREGAYDYLVKPVDCETLVKSIESAVESRREKRNRDLLLKKLAKRSKNLDEKVKDAKRATESEKTKSSIILDTLQLELKEAQEELEQSKEALQKATEEQEKLEGTLSTVKNEQDKLNEELTQANEARGDLEFALKSANEQRVTLEERLQETEGECQRLRAESEALREQINELQQKCEELEQKGEADFNEQALLCEAAAEITSLEDKVDELQSTLKAYRETRDSYSVQVATEMATLRAAASFMPRTKILQIVMLVCCLSGLALLATGAASGKLIPLGANHREMRTALAGQAVLAGLVAFVIVLLIRLLSVVDYLQLSLGQKTDDDDNVAERFLNSSGTICVAMSVTLIGVAFFVYGFGLHSEQWQKLMNFDVYALFSMIATSPHRDLGVLALVGAAIFLIGAAIVTTMRISSTFYKAIERHTERATTLERIEVL